MKLKNNGKTIELRVFDEEPHEMERRMGVRPGVFPEEIIVKRLEKDGTEKSVSYRRV